MFYVTFYLYAASKTAAGISLQSMVLLYMDLAFQDELLPCFLLLITFRHQFKKCNQRQRS